MSLHLFLLSSICRLPSPAGRTFQAQVMKLLGSIYVLRLTYQTLGHILTSNILDPKGFCWLYCAARHSFREKKITFSRVYSTYCIQLFLCLFLFRGKVDPLLSCYWLYVFSKSRKHIFVSFFFLLKAIKRPPENKSVWHVGMML